MAVSTSDTSVARSPISTLDRMRLFSSQTACGLGPKLLLEIALWERG